MKTDVYSWRVSRELKSELELEARRQKVPVSTLLERAARQLLKSACAEAGDEAEQRRLHRAAEKCFGTIALDEPYVSTKVSQVVRERLRAKYGR